MFLIFNFFSFHSNTDPRGDNSINYSSCCVLIRFLKILPHLQKLVLSLKPALCIRSIDWTEAGLDVPPDEIIHSDDWIRVLKFLRAGPTVPVHDFYQFSIAAMDGAPVTKQGNLQTLGLFSNHCEWQTHAFALKSGRPPMLLFSNSSSASGNSPSSFEGAGCIVFSSSSVVAPSRAASTDFTLIHVEYARNSAPSDKCTVESFELRAETEQARDAWVAAVHAEIVKANSGGAAPTASSASLAVAQSTNRQELLSAGSPPADVINLGGKFIKGKIQPGFVQLTRADLRLLAEKMVASPNLRVLNLNKNELGVSGVEIVARSLHALSALQELDLSSKPDRGMRFGGATILAEPLGNLISLRKLNLEGTVSAVLLD